MPSWPVLLIIKGDPFKFLPFFFVLPNANTAANHFCIYKRCAMKNSLLLLCCLASLKSLDAQVPTAMSPEANAFYSLAMPAIRQQVKTIILQTAGGMKHFRANADSLYEKLRVNKALKTLGKSDIEAITVLIMVQASKYADADIKLMVLGIGRRNDQGQQEQTGPQPVSVNNENKNRSADEASNIENSKLHAIMAGKSRLAEEINNVMTKISGAEQSIINNLR